MRSRLHQFLHGTRVVDLSRYLPGPLASLLKEILWRLPEDAVIVFESFRPGVLATAVLLRFAQVDCCLSPVLDIASAAETPHARARGIVQRTAEGSA